MNKDKKPKVCRSNIGGQAVLEGVMMKGVRSVATAVRAPGGEITVESKYVKSAKERNIFFRLPFVRGVVNLFTQLVQGTGLLMRSAEVYGDFEEPSKADKWVAEKLKIDPMNLLMTISVCLGIVLAVALFVFLPNFLAGLICDNVAAIAASSLKSLWYSLIEGGIMLAIFISYILLVTLMKDVRRVFMYHGAEHKVIACYEHGLELTVENAKKMKREHSRCGTTFLFFVVAVSIIVFVLINFMLEKCGLLLGSSVSGYKVLNALIKLGFKLLFLPVVAGFSYELLKLLAKSDALFVRILRAPGMALQLLTTKEPTDDMLEVSLTAFKTVLEMDENPNLPERKFEISIPLSIARDKLKQIAKGADDADLDWLLVEALSCRRSKLQSIGKLTKAQYEVAEGIAKKMSDGKPLQYALGYSEFYGLRLAVNPFTLIPRPETEELAKSAIDEVTSAVRKREGSNGENSEINPAFCDINVNVLDLCTGSGAIAIAVAKNTSATVFASDVSGAAIEVAKANAISLGAKASFATGDMFAPWEGKKFDVIVCNPPYIPTGDIASLDDKVKKFEPTLALAGGKDGLDFYRKIAAEYSEYLVDGGALLLEMGVGQAADIAALFGVEKTEIIKDIEGVERIARIVK